jgi:neutral trehalase
MKLIEGMKTLRVIQKRIQQNAERINEYAAIVSTEKPTYGSELEQRKQVESLIQSNLDLSREYLNLKKTIDYTNLMTKVTIGKDTFSISDLLQIRRNIANLMIGTFDALNERKAEARLLRIKAITSDKAPRIERMYDENTKFEGLQYWQGLKDEIEIRLEVINATTELLDVPQG